MNNENSRPTQCQRIMRHLRDYGSITSLEAISEYGIMRLASRVSELNKNGENIICELVSGKNRYGEPCRWARYSLAEKQSVNINDLIKRKAI